MEGEFKPDTIVRLKQTGTFGKIVKRCICGNAIMPIHYEVLIESKTEGQYHIMGLYHSELELECLPIRAEHFGGYSLMRAEA